jgi:hypothetical protein
MNSDAADDSPAGARASADFVADWDIGADLLAHIDVAGDLLLDSGVCDGPLIELLNDSHATADLTAPCSDVAANPYNDSDAAAASLAESEVAAVSLADSGVADADWHIVSDAMAAPDSLTN